MQNLIFGIGRCKVEPFQFILLVWEETMPRKTRTPEYTSEHAHGGVKAALPEIETWDNQYHGYEITITIPEFTCICPRTGQPDFGTITIHYLPHKLCLELKSLKSYIVAFRNLGIFNENAANRILDDVALACKPKWAVVKGEFSARGGMRTLVEARYPRKKYDAAAARRTARTGQVLQGAGY
jgi:7-cyano-7-deazaguanine reductase